MIIPKVYQQLIKKDTMKSLKIYLKKYIIIAFVIKKTLKSFKNTTKNHNQKNKIYQKTKKK